MGTRPLDNNELEYRQSEIKRLKSEIALREKAINMYEDEIANGLWCSDADIFKKQ